MKLLKALMFAMIAMPTAAAALCGDADDDGNITVNDGIRALRSAADLGGACPDDSVCDVDANGTTTLIDGVNVLRAAAHLSNPCDDIPENCGNGLLDAGEDCEYVGRLVIGGLCGEPLITMAGCSGELCRVNCQCQPPTCGNCLLEEGEECDDLNTESGDGCSPECLLE